MNYFKFNILFSKVIKNKLFFYVFFSPKISVKFLSNNKFNIKKNLLIKYFFNLM